MPLYLDVLISLRISTHSWYAAARLPFKTIGSNDEMTLIPKKKQRASLTLDMKLHE